ncbi:type III-A CRISPR-associated protein Cas10/Csm1 [Desulfobulbus alkaliphilus]|uniref:type III-A CRISPR-associated protein Cas10/Csm1 n=1 Tax=Desulfobulbus alkaliphilus TaxID=869814 RepID=UPI0019663D14|nr:type III-A CRISPR-associated protein Cas10/Csm1 [Desulfobulbus alkaliphilus]MBM9536298.1 type III-A CRISPR-associated protein Cas10/Csm1 [Desulfobulbus alkaliphilus]
MENISNTGQLGASCRVAFAALTHDLGKFAERAAPNVEGKTLDAHITNYCRWHEQGKYHSHKHAAYTALYLDVIEKSAPDLIDGETAPFASRNREGDITDSVINAAAMHHRPETLLQWIIATADRVASGFEREEYEKYNKCEDRTNTASKSGRNHYQARLLTLFEQVRLERQDTCTFKWCYRLKPLTPDNMFPLCRDGYEPTDNGSAQAEYQQLWQEFVDALQKIPASHRTSWPLWLDHFDTLWQSYTHAIPSATAFGIRPEVSLYDHSKATAAFAVALWRWHEAQGNLTTEDAIRRHKDRADWDEEKFLLVQGDFFGIQDFIFADGAETNKKAAKLLRGRSFMVSLFSELAALRILEVLELPSTSQIINAAGKFQIVAPNTIDIRTKLAAVRKDINDWFLKHTYGLAGLGLVWNTACCNDFLTGRFENLLKTLFIDLEHEKLRRFELTGDTPTVFDVNYEQGICQYNNRLPADKLEQGNKGSSSLSRDQIEIGTALVNRDRLLVTRNDADLRQGSVKTLETVVFGYRVGFTQEEEITGRFGQLAQSGGLLRCWDFSLPDSFSDTLWHGYARRYINAYVPIFTAHDQLTSEKYQGLEKDDDCRPANPKTFSHIACEDRSDKEEKGQWLGQVALTTVKGDVDNLGMIFQHGMGGKSTFAKMAALSRQMNAFFTVWLPAFCKKNYPNVYTVFAGGDDFFLIGPWYSTQKLVADMARQFKWYVAENPEIHFSAGMVMTKPKHPIHSLAVLAEEALENAKGYETDERKQKNAISLYGEIVPWPDWDRLASLEADVQLCAARYRLSTSYIYGLFHLIDLAADSNNIESVMWHSRFAYRTKRYVVDKLDKNEREGVQIELTEIFGKNIGTLKRQFRIPLFNYFYSKRQGGKT